VQFLLEPGQSVSRRLELPQGSYRVRSTAAAAPHFLEVRPGGAPEARFAFGAAHETADAAALPACTLHFHNDSDCEALIAVERTAWADDACSAAYVSTFQEYRDLFGRDVLGPGVAVKISTMALLFTDVKGSTALYERIGDAPAFGLVRTHFDLLTDAVREHGGAVIKTIGDAVMAAFLEPAQAVAAALDMHARVTTLMSDDGQPIVLKIGLHAGPCFAVTMNETLDYFGNVVNLAARIQGLATGGDVVLDSELARRPEVAAVIGGRRTEPFTLELRGFRGARSFVRVLPS
jgi:class 3 adenylate cyclase